MAIDFSSLGATPAKTGKIDFSAIGGIPAVGQNEPTDETTALGAVGRGAVGMLPLGTQALAATAGAVEKEPYLQERQEIEKEIQTDIANHPVARLAGQAAGVVAPALISGGSSAPESLLGAVGQGAGIGAGFGAGNALDTLASGGSGGQAAANVALGAGLGAAGGAVGQKLAELTQPLTKSLTGLANKKAVQAANIRPGTLGLPEDELQELGQKMHNWGLVEGSTGDRVLKSQVLLNKVGGQIGEMGAGAQQLDDVTPYAQNLMGKAAENSRIDAPEFQAAAKTYTAGANALQGLARPTAVEQMAPRLDEFGKALVNPTLPSLETAPVTFDDLAALKKTFGEQAFDANGDVQNKAAADVYGQIKDAMKAIVNKAPGEYQDAMDNYGALKDISSGLTRQLQMEQAQGAQAKGFGMAGRLMAMAGKNPALNAVAGAGLTAAGHPLLGLGAMTPILTNPQTMSTLARQAASALPKIAGALPAASAQLAGANAPIAQNMGETKVASSATSTSPSTGSASTTINVNHPILAPWKQVFQKNAANAKNDGEVQKSNAVTDFILSQRDPAYAAAKQKMTETPEAQATTSTAASPTGMADGGVVPSDTNDFSKPTPEFGSTLQGLADQLKNPTHETPPPQPESLPAYTTQKFHEPFNSDFADKLKEFLDNRQKEKDDAESR